jgi:hypothetical protein
MLSREEVERIFNQVFERKIENLEIPQDGDCVEDDCGELHHIDWCGATQESFCDDFLYELEDEGKEFESEEECVRGVEQYIEDQILYNEIMFYDYDGDGGDGLGALGDWEIVEVNIKRKRR